MTEQGEGKPRRALPPDEETLPHEGTTDDQLAGDAVTEDAESPSAVLEEGDGAPPEADTAPPQQADTAPPPEDTPGDRPVGRRLAPWLIGGAVVVVGGLVAAGTLLGQGGGGPGATPTPTIDPVATYLLQPADLAGLREGVIWEAASTDTRVAAGTPQPTCFAAAADTEPVAANTLVRTFAPAGGPSTAGAATAGGATTPGATASPGDAGVAGGVLHQVDTYASPEEATAAYAARVQQLGACARNTALLIGGWDVAGLSDESTAATYVFQDTENEYHAFLLARTGTRVNVLDATQPEEPADVTALARVASAATGRQCAQGGSCPTDVTATPGTPPPTDPVGWLSAVDLPRLTPGAGSWRGTLMPELRVVGTRCENVDLAAVPDVTVAEQRTYLVADDASIPAGFGLDEVIYHFGSAEQAAGFVGSVSANIDGCGDRAATAQVTRLTDLTGDGTGAAWTVTQQTDENHTTATFRVSVQSVGDRVVYLMANPTGDVDFNDAEWGQVSVRAAQRATQAPAEVTSPSPDAPSEPTGDATAGPAGDATETAEPTATP